MSFEQKKKKKKGIGCLAGLLLLRLSTMFVKRLIHKAKAIPEVLIPQGTLSKEEINPRLTLHHGLPETASILAFHPVQRLLAVASLNGQIKVLGAPGVEALFLSPTRAPCKFLQFTSEGRQLVHITAQNEIEVQDLQHGLCFRCGILETKRRFVH